MSIRRLESEFLEGRLSRDNFINFMFTYFNLNKQEVVERVRDLDIMKRNMRVEGNIKDLRKKFEEGKLREKELVKEVNKRGFNGSRKEYREMVKRWEVNRKRKETFKVAFKNIEDNK